MARPTKQGLDYYPQDVEDDNKIKLIKAKFGPAGKGIIHALWQSIYQDKGYYYECDGDNIMIFCMDENCDKDLVDDVIESALNWKIFDRNMYEKYHILTSKGIQKRYLEATKKRANTCIDDSYNVMNYSNNVVNSEKTGVNSEKTTVQVEFPRVSAEFSTQRKGKKRKEKESKEKKLVRARPREGQQTNSEISLYGKFKNVELSDTELADIKATYEKPMLLIDKVSGIMANLKTKRDNHHAYIYTIAENDKWPRKVKHKPPDIPPAKALTPQEQAEAEAAKAKVLDKLKDVF